MLELIQAAVRPLLELTVRPLLQQQDELASKVQNLQNDLDKIKRDNEKRDHELEMDRIERAVVLNMQRQDAGLSPYRSPATPAGGSSGHYAPQFHGGYADPRIAAPKFTG